MPLIPAAAGGLPPELAMLLGGEQPPPAPPPGGGGDGADAIIQQLLGASDLPPEPTRRPTPLQGRTDPEYGTDEGDSGTGADCIQKMMVAADEYKQRVNEPAKLLEMEKVTTQLQKLLADEQADQDNLLQGKASPSALRHAGAAA